jgi:hypothetical protein
VLTSGGRFGSFGITAKSDKDYTLAVTVWSDEADAH